MKKIAAMWDDAQKDAQKIVGKDAALPYWPEDPKALADAYNKSMDRMLPAINALIGVYNDLIGSRSDFYDACDKLSKVASKSNFGLDEKSKDDVKKIQAARKVLTEGINSITARAESVSKENTNAYTKLLKELKY